MISLCMIVKNGEKDIVRCLESVKGLVDEIILVDTGSNDRTKEIAEKYGARIFDFKWDNNFSNARNFSIEKAKGDWILILDQDEVLSKSDFENIKVMVSKKEFLGYYITQRDYTNEIGVIGWVSCKDDKYGESKTAFGFVPAKIVRLFRNDSRIRFKDPAHPSVELSIKNINGNIGVSEVVIHHFGFINKNKEKIQKYIDIGKENKTANYYQEYQIGSQLRNIGNLGEALKHLTESIKLNDNFYLSLLELGILFIQLGKVSEAKRFLLESLKIKEHDMAWNHLGIVMAYENNSMEAIKCFEKAILLSPKNADFRFNLSQALRKFGSIKEADFELDIARELNPSYK